MGQQESRGKLERRRSDRLHSLDALRGFALLSGVALHATMAFIPNVQLWIIREQPSLTLAVLFYWIHIFRMTVFFVLAGLFGRLLLERLGVGGFVKDRAKRIAAPFVVFYPLVGAATVACAIWAMRTTGQSLIPGGGAGAARPELSLETVPLTHLWFLYVLLLLYLSVLFARGFLRVLGPAAQSLRAIFDRASQASVKPFGAVLLAAPLACAFLLTPEWRAWLGVLPPAFGFVPNAAALVGYGTAFALGWALHRQPPLLLLMEKHWRKHLILACVATLFCVTQVGIHPTMEFTPLSPVIALYACAYATAVWSWTLALIALALRYFSKERRFLRYAADSSYWIYIIHIPVLAALQVLIHPLTLGPLAKYILTLVVLAIILPLTYELLVRHSFLGKWLNGRAYPRPRKAV